MSTYPPRTVALACLAGLAGALQLGPRYMHAPGYLLAAASTLPIAIGSALRPQRSTWLFAAAALLVGMFSDQQLFIFLTTTGPLGLMLGLTEDHPAWHSVLAATLALVAGLLLLPSLSGFYPFGGMDLAWLPLQRLGVYTAFSLIYAALWTSLFRRLWRRIQVTMGRPKGYTGGDKP